MGEIYLSFKILSRLPAQHRRIKSAILAIGPVLYQPSQVIEG
jgi:hypothetical protein